MTKILHNEKELLKLVGRGNEAAFRTVVHYYTPLIFSYLFKIMRSRERAQEVVQDVFVQVWITRETLDQIRDFRSFLIIISRNLGLNAFRGMMREELRKSKWSQRHNEEFQIWPQESCDERQTLLNEAIALLPRQQRTAGVLNRREAKTYAEVATDMNISLNYPVCRCITYLCGSQ